MLRVDYTAEDRKAFDHWRYHYPEVCLMRRFEMLWLHAHGKHTSEIATLVKKSSATVRKVIHMFREGGIELVMTIDSNHPKSKLEPHPLPSSNDPSHENDPRCSGCFLASLIGYNTIVR